VLDTRFFRLLAVITLYKFSFKTNSARLELHRVRRHRRLVVRRSRIISVRSGLLLNLMCLRLSKVTVLIATVIYSPILRSHDLLV